MIDLSQEQHIREVFEGKIIGDEMLWKYFKPERFISTLNDSDIYFASANQFDDPFEGALAVQTPPQQVDPRYSEMEPSENAFLELKRLTKISCWHRSEYENDAMWKLYAGLHKGIAICTTPDRIRKAFRPFRLKPDYGPESLWIGPVEYVDLTQVRMENAGMLNRFFFKHRAFEWEREFRLAISLRMAEEYCETVPLEGIFVKVDLKALVQRIIVGSTTTQDELALISKHVAEAGLEDRFELSSLLGVPRYV